MGILTEKRRGVHPRIVHTPEAAKDFLERIEASPKLREMREKHVREQLEKAGCPERAALPFQKAILEERLPFTIGGGIGQSRICMFFLRKAHIGEVHSSIWPDDVVEACEKAGIALL